MKHKLFILLFLASGCRLSYAQLIDTCDQYSGGKEIIKDLDSIVNSKGIQQIYEASIGGIKQWVYVRGQDTANAMILFIHGGPASPISPVMWMFQRPVEEYFTVVNYDQRAAGKTFNSNDTSGLGTTIHINEYVDDVIELAAFIEKKYHKRKVILMGHSWGTVIGMNAAIKRPDLFYAYVGIGQVINTRDNERLSYDFAVAQARQFKNDTAVRELKSIAPYPGNKPITRERIIIARKWAQYYGGLSAFRHDSKYYFDAPLLSPEYTGEDVKAIDEGNVFTLGRILPEFLRVDFKPIKRFPIPVLMFMGRHDYTTPSVPTALWLSNVVAPFKKGVWFENSAHLIPFEEPGKFLMALVEYVRPLALKWHSPIFLKS
jgi:pimeloyl-ACP methyl ester carboxylesterase